MYVHKPCGFFIFFGGGHPENVTILAFLQFSKNIDGFRQSDSQGF